MKEIRLLEDIEPVMTRQERAKQFMPFDAMKGLQEALRDREEKYSRVERRERGEDALALLSSEITRLERGDQVKILYYHSFHEVEKVGFVEKIDMVYRYIIVAGEKIVFDDIYEMKKIYPQNIYNPKHEPQPRYSSTTTI